MRSIPYYYRMFSSSLEYQICLSHEYNWKNKIDRFYATKKTWKLEKIFNSILYINTLTYKSSTSAMDFFECFYSNLLKIIRFKCERATHFFCKIKQKKTLTKQLLLSLYIFHILNFSSIKSKFYVTSISRFQLRSASSSDYFW